MTEKAFKIQLAKVLEVYAGNDGEKTKALYAELESKHGPAGIVAVNVFRATKTSAAAKRYRGARYKGPAYDRKSWSIGNLCSVLAVHGASLGIKYGWGVDERAKASRSPHHHVFYCSLPTGQVSFHNGSRLNGPDFAEPWDGVRQMGPTRICSWIAHMFSGTSPEHVGSLQAAGDPTPESLAAEYPGLL